MQRALSLLILASALGSGLIAGVFLAFSSFVMPALGRLPAPQGIAAMQSINIVVLNRVFLGVFVGTMLSCAVLGVWSAVRWSDPGSWLAIAGSLLYIVGVFGVTRGLNIPLNDALSALNPETAEAAAFWKMFLTDWTRWNTLRTLGGLAGAAALTLSLMERARALGSVASLLGR